jgi:hypothetical protein
MCRYHANRTYVSRLGSLYAPASLGVGQLAARPGGCEVLCRTHAEA